MGAEFRFLHRNLHIRRQQQGVDGRYIQKVDYSNYDSQKRALAAVEYYGESYYDQENQEQKWRWTKNQSYERAFDDAGRQTMHSYIFNYSDGNTYGYKEEYACDANGNRILYVGYTHDSAIQAFVPEYKSEYTYGDRIVQSMFDSDYIPLTVKYSEWDSESGAWVVEMEGKFEWQFDANNNPSTMTMSTKAGNEWIWYGTAAFYYSLHEISGIAGLQADDCSVWISEGRLHIENGVAGTVQVFDISGRQRLNAYLSGSQSLDVSHLQQGIYVVRINEKTFKVIRK